MKKLVLIICQYIDNYKFYNTCKQDYEIITVLNNSVKCE